MTLTPTKLKKKNTLIISKILVKEDEIDFKGEIFYLKEFRLKRLMGKPLMGQIDVINMCEVHKAPKVLKIVENMVRSKKLIRWSMECFKIYGNGINESTIEELLTNWDKLIKREGKVLDFVYIGTRERLITYSMENTYKVGDYHKIYDYIQSLYFLDPQFESHFPSFGFEPGSFSYESRHPNYTIPVYITSKLVQGYKPDIEPKPFEVTNKALNHIAIKNLSIDITDKEYIKAIESEIKEDLNYLLNL